MIAHDQYVCQKNAMTLQGGIPGEDPWYAFSVKSRHEKKVEAGLTLRLFHAFLPLYACRRKWADRYQTVDLPLFPGYVFCNCATTSIGPILNVPGVVDVVRAGRIPAPVSEDEMVALQHVVNSNLATDPWPSLVVGEKVSITDGPLAGLSGSLVQIKAAWRLVVSVALLQRSVLVQIDRDWVTPYRPMNRFQVTAQLKRA